MKKNIIFYIIAISLIISSCSDGDPINKGKKFQKPNPPDNIVKDANLSTTITGVLVDGYIKDATICIDDNDYGSCIKEAQTKTKTNNKGEFSLTIDAKENTFHTLIGVGGIDTAINRKFNGTYKAIIKINDASSRGVQNINITPITTLTAYIYNKKRKENPTYDLSVAINKVATSLGLSSSQILKDPFKDKVVFEKSQQIVQAVAILGSTLQADETNSNTKKAFDFVMSKLSDSISQDKHQGAIDSSKVVSLLNKSNYEGKDVNISSNVSALVEKNAKNIKEKVATSDIKDLVKTQKDIQSSTDTAISSVGFGSGLVNSQEASTPILTIAPNISDIADKTLTLGAEISTINFANTGGTITSCEINTTLPSGLIFNTSTCAISGTPTLVTAKTVYKITATNKTGSDIAIIKIETIVDITPPAKKLNYK